MNKHAFGNAGQEAAKRYLLGKGYVFVAEHITGTYGEIDLLFRDGDQWVFAEVKTRSGGRSDSAYYAITDAKKEKILLTGTEYLANNDINTDNYRIDGVGVRVTGTDVEITHWRGIG